MQDFLGGRSPPKGLLLQLDHWRGLPLGLLCRQGLPEMSGCLGCLPGHCLGLLHLLILHRCWQLMWHWGLAFGGLPDDGWAMHSLRGRLWSSLRGSLRGRHWDRQRGRQHWLGHLRASGWRRGYLRSSWWRRHLRRPLHLRGQQPSLRGLPQWRWGWQGMPQLWLGGYDLWGWPDWWWCLADQWWCLADYRWGLAQHWRWARADGWWARADGWGPLAYRWWCLPGYRRCLPGDLCGLPGQRCGLPALWWGLPAR